MRIGFGYDVHELVVDRALIIGGVDIPHEKGLLGHSDADVLIHAIMDSILGALALGDIGAHFPDTDPLYKDISSIDLLKNVKETMGSANYKIGNIDATVAAQLPKLAPFILEMRENIAGVLDCAVEDINIKATTTEKLGFVGRKEGMSSYSVCMLKPLK